MIVSSHKNDLKIQVPHPFKTFKPAGTRHLDIHKYQIGCHAANKPYPLFSGTGLSHHGNVGEPVKHLPEVFPVIDFIFDYQCIDHWINLGKFRQIPATGSPPGYPLPFRMHRPGPGSPGAYLPRSEEHTSELQSLMRISYDDFCLKKKK